MNLFQNGSGKKATHTINKLTDEDLATIYRHFPVNHPIRNKIRQHLYECVTDEDLEDAGGITAEEYMNNWLGGAWEETRKEIPTVAVNHETATPINPVVDPITPIMSQTQIPGED